MKQSLLYISLIACLHCYSQLATQHYVDSSINAFAKTLDTIQFKQRNYVRDTVVYGDTFTCAKFQMKVFEFCKMYKMFTQKDSALFQGVEVDNLYLFRDSSGNYQMWIAPNYNSDAAVKLVIQVVKINGLYMLEFLSRFGYKTQMYYYIKEKATF